MYTDKRAMSGIITMLILIALALVAVGVIWFVIQGVLDSAGGEVTQGTGNLFGNCKTNNTMVNETYFNSTFPVCGGNVRIIGGKYCCNQS